MRYKKKWVFFSVVLAVLILVTGILAGAAYAQTPTPTDADSGKTLLGRVAAILGIEQQEVEDAFAQARKEMRSEAQKARLDKLVEQGRITQEQADDYQTWLESRPDVPANLDIMPGKRLGPRGQMNFWGGHPCFPGKVFNPNSPSPTAAPSVD